MALKSYHLFIGGCADGKKLLVIGDRPIIKVPCPGPPLKISDYLDTSTDMKPIECHVYRRELLSTGERILTMYIYDRLSVFDSMVMLLDNYGQKHDSNRTNRE